MYRYFLFLMMAISSVLQGMDIDCLQRALRSQKSPFSYPLDIKVIRGPEKEGQVILCCHGYGSNSSLVDVIASHRVTSAHLVGFNFPDYNISLQKTPRRIHYGTIDEILPAIYMLKLIVVNGGASAVSLYGFSAGGGAVVNIIGTLNTCTYDRQLQAVGISLADKKTILEALQNGVVLLDAPLKSIEEILAALPSIPGDDTMIKNYRNNQMRPIDALRNWEGLNLSVIVFFQNPDESLTNRDDLLFAQRVRQYNPLGRNKILILDEGGHRGFHYSLWKAYDEFSSKT